MTYKVAAEEFIEVIFKIVKRKNPQLELDIWNGR
jgi:hypothetical protein